jgi:hypothetical protein
MWMNRRLVLEVSGAGSESAVAFGSGLAVEFDAF